MILALISYVKMSPMITNKEVKTNRHAKKKKDSL